jgi:hypothetical protein
VNIRQMTAGRSRYNALILKLDKRLSNGFGGRFNYTWSNLKDNQFGESNHFQSNRAGSGTAARPQNNYDLDAEYATSLLDTPHRIVLAPIFELPFGQGKRWANSRAADLLIGGWTASAVVSIESGFPTPTRYSVAFSQNHLGNFGNVELRPNVVPGDPNTDGSLYERITYVGNPRAWADRDGYEQPARGQLGNMERTDTRLRSPIRRNLDLSLNKAFRTGGSTRAELRFELINATNTPKFRDYNVLIDQGTFGQITRQSAFSRIVQIMMRFSF